jgi:hypothetical protein
MGRAPVHPVIRRYEGWGGLHTREQAAGAIPNATRVYKDVAEVGDSHPVGSRATVLGSLYLSGLGYGYFVEWDAQPRVAVLVAGRKIRIERQS